MVQISNTTYCQLSPALSIVSNLSYAILSPMQHYVPNKTIGYIFFNKLNKQQTSIERNWNIIRKKQLLDIIFITTIPSLTSSNTRLMNLNESNRVRMISATGTPKYVKGSINHRKANASCSGVVVARQRLELWKIFHKNRDLNLRIIKSSFVLRNEKSRLPHINECFRYSTYNFRN